MKTLDQKTAKSSPNILNQSGGKSNGENGDVKQTSRKIARLSYPIKSLKSRIIDNLCQLL